MTVKYAMSGSFVGSRGKNESDRGVVGFTETGTMGQLIERDSWCIKMTKPGVGDEGIKEREREGGGERRDTN